MTIEQLLFWVISLAMLGSAVMMVTARSILVAALWMIGAFAGTAALFVMLGAGFLGVVQVLIYIGAIAVLILFAIMLTPHVMGGEDTPRYNEQWVLVGVLAAGLAGLLVALVQGTNWPVLEEFAPTQDYALVLGRAFMTEYVLPFEVASVVLLVALIGALVIAREE